jgi:diguanylate cyclase (GGDEF)-like protein/PAS domain S-box-containing protein
VQPCGVDAERSRVTDVAREEEHRVNSLFLARQGSEPRPVPIAAPVDGPLARAWHGRVLGLDAAIIAVCLLLIGTLWVSVFTRARIERRDTLAAAIVADDNGAATFEQYTVRTLDNADALLQAVRREYARSGPLTDLGQLLRDLGIGADAYQGIGIIDEHGALVMTTMPSADADVYFFDREHFSVHARQDSGKLFVGKPVLSRLLGVMSIPLTRRINKADGSFGGVVVAQIEPTRFTDLFRDATHRAGDVLSLVGLDGITRARRVGNRLSAGEDLSKSPVIVQWQDSASGHYAAAGALDGVHRLYSYRRLRDYPLVATKGRTELDVFADVDVRHARIRAIAAAMTALVAAMALLWIIALHRKHRALLKLAGSEARLSATFNQASVGVAISRSDGRFLQVNQKFCDIVGYSEAEMLQRNANDITHPDDLALTDAYYAELAAQDDDAQPRNREKRYVRKDGTTVWVAVSAASAPAASGGGPTFVAIIQDITARKLAEERLRRVARGRRLMAECSRILVHAPDEARLLKAMCAALVGPGGYALAYVGMAEHDEAKSIRLVAQAGGDENYARSARPSWGEGERGQATSGRAIRLGTTQAVADIVADPALALWHDLARAQGFHSVVSLPLSRLGVPFGALTIHAQERNAFDTNEIGLLEELAADLAYGIISLRTRVAHAASVAKLLESEERTRRYFEMGPIGMAIMSPAMEWLDVNQQLCAMLHYDRDELLRTSWSDVVHADDRDADHDQLDRVNAGVIDGYALTLRMTRSTGQPMIASIAVKCVKRLDGAVDYLLVQIEDVTERKRQEVALKQASERLAQQSRLFDASLSALSDLAFTLDAQGCFLYANASLLNVWGLPLADVVGKNFFDLGYPHDQAALLHRQVRQVVEQKRKVVDETRYAGPAGSPRDYEYILNPVFAPDGSVEMIAGSGRDITERKLAEDALRAGEREQRQLVVELDVERERLIAAQAVAKVGSWETDLATFAVIWSSEVHRIYETDAASFCPTHASFLGFIHRDDRQKVEAAFRDSLHQSAAAAIEHRIVMPDGRVKIVEEHWQVFHDAEGQPLRALGTSQDITERTHVEDQFRLQADLLAAVGEAVIATDLEGKITYSNRYAESLYGWTASEMHGRDIGDVAPVAPSDAGAKDLRASISTGVSWSGELNILRRDGTPFPVQVSISPIHDKTGALIGTIGVSADISERKLYEGRIEYLATHDALTDLPNRNLLNDRLTQASGHAQRSSESVAVIFLDLDHFKFFNDAYGHPLGDALLKAVAVRLKATVRQADTVARLGGDEFVVLATDLADPLLGASEVARSIVAALAQPFAIDGREFTVTASMGISLYPVDGTNLDELLKNADAAMYRAKDSGRNDYKFYATEMSQKATARVTMELALRHAARLGQFELHYQPLIEMRTGEVSGLEALIRWRHPELGMIAPADFIPLAEETGLIVSIGDWVLKTACEQNKAWQDAGLPALAIGVNLSALQLRQPGFVAGVERVLAESGLAARCLNLELTESMVMGTADAVIASLQQLRALGVTLSMDDFGTGYSNLGHLTHLPLDILKIDRSFISGLPGHQGAASIARAIVSMGHSLGMRVVAEGVETVEQAEFLRSIWCEYAQGYLFCKPLGAIACATWMRERSGNAATSKPPRGPLVKRVA